jgi:release factor glutamine methyltransferase
VTSRVRRRSDAMQPSGSGSRQASGSTSDVVPAVTIGEVLRRSTDHLAERGVEAPRLRAERLLAHALGLQRVELYMHFDRPLEPAELDDARALLARHAAGEPLQYVLGVWGFRRLTLAVDRRALIPRPETEVVVERCLALLDGADAPRVLDVGTGSGAIALAIADEHPSARVSAIDVSEDALQLARANAERTGLAIDIAGGDVLRGLPGEGWDLVVSNPPYVLEDELASLPRTVADWEPEVALVDRGQTGALVDEAARVLRPGGALVLEAHADGAAALGDALGAHGYQDVRVTADLAGRDRVVEGRRPG